MIFKMFSHRNTLFFLPTLLLLGASSSLGGKIRQDESDDGKMTPIDNLMNMFREQANIIQQMQAKIRALESKETAQDLLINQLQGASSSSNAASVGFTVEFSGDEIALRDDEVLKFDHVVTNLGSGYNPSTGIFTAPVTGTYVFLLNIMGSINHGRIYVDIMKNGAFMQSAFAEGGVTDQLDQGSSTVVTHLNAGERVWCQEGYSGDGMVGGTEALHGGKHSEFTGYLL